MKAVDDILFSAPDYDTRVSWSKCIIFWGKYQTKHVWVREASVRAKKTKTCCRSYEPEGEENNAVWLHTSKLDYILWNPFTHIFNIAITVFTVVN